MRNIQKQTKSAQTMSVEMLITISIFVAFFVIVLSFLLYSQSESIESAVSEAEILNRFISDASRPQTRLITERNTVDEDVLAEIANLSELELIELFEVSDSFCIMFVDKNGNIMFINESSGKKGLGSSTIEIDGLPCGATSFP